MLLLLTIFHSLCNIDITLGKSTEDSTAWHVLGIREYFIYKGHELRTFEESRKKCNEMESRLVKVDTDVIHHHLVEILKNFTNSNENPPYTSYFIGLKDITGGNVDFYWEDGNMLHYRTDTPMQWAEGEPNNFNNIDEDCVTMGISSKTAEYKWFDVPCDVKRSYICDRPSVHNETTTTTMWATSVTVFAVILIVFLTAFQQRARLFRRQRDIQAPSENRVIEWFTGANVSEEVLLYETEGDELPGNTPSCSTEPNKPCNGKLNY